MLLIEVIAIVNNITNKIKVNEKGLACVKSIYQDIRNKIITAREKMFKHIDTTMVEVYWYVGKITYNLSNNDASVNYGKKIIDELSLKLTKEFGSGFSSVSIRRMRRFYEMYPIWSTVSTRLSWSHFQELIKIDRKEERDFYELETINSNWGCRELCRQINTKLYDRYLVSPNKNMILDESKKGLIKKTA